MKKVHLNMFIDVLMLPVFILCALTGFIKLPLIVNYLDLFEYIPFELVSKIHDYSGVLFILLIIVHVVLHKKHLCGMIEIMKKRKSGRKQKYDYKRPL